MTVVLQNVKRCTKHTQLIHNSDRAWKTLNNQTAVAYLFICYLVQSIIVADIYFPWNLMLHISHGM